MPTIPSPALLLLTLAVLPGAERTVALTTLDLGAMSTGWGTIGVDRTVEGRPLHLGGRAIAHGVGTHANSSLNIELKGATRFTARVGVDDEVGNGKGSVSFQVVVDGVERFASGVMRAGDQVKLVDLDLHGARQMTLLADDAGDGTGADHADWAEAVFQVAGEAPVAALAAPRVPVTEAVRPGPPLTPPEAATRALAIVNAWQNDHPHRATRLLRVMYWTPADREPLPACRERLTRVMDCIRDFYAAQMEGWGLAGGERTQPASLALLRGRPAVAIFPEESQGDFLPQGARRPPATPAGCFSSTLGRRTVNLERDADGLLRLRMVRGSIGVPMDQQEAVGDSVIHKDCEAALAKDGLRYGDETVLVFTNLTTWDPVARTLRHYSPYHGGGSHWAGGCMVVDSELLDARHLADRGDMLKDKEYGSISLGKYNSDFIGGVAHELGHTLGLPHCCEATADRASRGRGLMGYGKSIGEELRGESPGMFITFPHALRLLTHVQFSGSVKQAKDAAQVTWTGLSVATDPQGALVVAGSVQGRIPVYGVVGYADPEGGGDYNAQIGGTAPQADGSFTMTIPAPAAGKAKGGELRLVACCANGAATAYAGYHGQPAFAFGFDQGKVDLRVTNEVMAIEEARSGPQSAEARARLSPRQQEVLRRLQAADGSTGKAVPAQVDATIHALPLSDTTPQSGGANPGRMHFDRLVDGRPLVKSGMLYGNGLQVRSPSRQVWHLGRAWGTLRGSCGRTEDGNRSHALRFIIRGDGKELWNSGKTEDATATFAVPLDQIDNLELAVEAVVAGKDADAAWFEPVLDRP